MRRVDQPAVDTPAEKISERAMIGRDQDRTGSTGAKARQAGANPESNGASLRKVGAKVR